MRKLILILAIWAAAPVLAGATTFAPFPVTRQIQQAETIFRGRVTAVTTRLEPASQRPYTYWTFSVQETFSGDGQSSQWEVRQPGGELGDLGYRVPGAASFREGEEVIVAARNTNEDALELIGLASGKYTILKQEDGREILENGLGIIVAGADGKALTTDDFRALVKRVVSGNFGQEDEKIVIDPSRAHSPQHAHFVPGGASDQVNKSDTMVAAGTAEAQNPATPEKKLGIEGESSDRQIASQGEVRWLGVFVAVIFFASFGGLFHLLTRKKRT